MHVFADALPHVPDHRRLPVLTQLVTTMGPAHFLWVLMLLLFKLRVLHTAGFSSEKVSPPGGDTKWLLKPSKKCVLVDLCVCVCVCDQDGALDQNVDFWISLCGQFEVSDIITTVINILKFQQKLPHDKDDGETTGPGPSLSSGVYLNVNKGLVSILFTASLKPSTRGRGAKKKKEAEETAEELIFDMDTHSSKELRHFNFLSVSFTAQLLGSNTFIAKVSG